jgi:hypothetical protein
VQDRVAHHFGWIVDREHLGKTILRVVSGIIGLLPLFAAATIVVTYYRGH